jgi:membrane-associated protein
VIAAVSISHLSSGVAYAAMAGLIGGESMGMPLPGETSLIAAGVLAQQGHLQIAAVIAIAAAAAIVGDNAGFVLGRHGGRRLLERPGPFERQRRRLVESGEPFFARHGPKAVFLARWIVGLRIAAAWLAGINRMRWPVFLCWNALGGIGWATSVGLLAYLLGHAAAGLVSGVGLLGLVLVVVAGAALVLNRRLRRSTPSNAGPGVAP